MKTPVKILAVVCLLVICVPAVAQPDILSAVPADAYGFVATKNLQGSYDKIMAFAQAMGIPVPTENKLLAIQEMLGEVDLNGPAAVVLLDPQKFSGKPFALLFSSADAKNILEKHRAEAAATDVELPAGVVAGAGGYMTVKDGFIVFAFKPEQAAAVLASQTPFETMPAVKAAFDNGQIVLAGDLQRAGPWIIQMLDTLQATMTAQMTMAPGPQAAMAKDMFSMYLNLAQGLIEQCDKLTVILDVTADRAILTKWTLFKADSPAAAFMNSQKGRPIPTYGALPGGPFFLAGGANVATEQLQSLTQTIIKDLMNLPSFKEKLSAEQIQKMINDSIAANTLISGCSFTFNLGNPMTGMFNIVVRADVSDAKTYRELLRKLYESEGIAVYAKASGMPIEYVYTSAAETYSNVQIDTIKMQMTPPAEGTKADPMMAQQMQIMAMMYGPDMTFRLAAPTDKQVLFTMGGGAEQMERAINVAQGNGSVLADETAIKMGTANLPAGRFAEAHLNIGQVMPMIMMMAMMGGAGQPGAMPPAAATDLAPVSLSCSAETNTFRADVVVPAATIKNLVDTLGPMFGPHPASKAEPEPPSEDF